MWQRLVEAPITRLDQMLDSPISKVEKFRKIINKTIKRNIDFSCLNINIIYNRPL